MRTSPILAFCLNRSHADLLLNESLALPDGMSLVVTRCITTYSSISLIKVHTWHCCSTHTGALRLANYDGMLAEPARCRIVA